MVNFVDKFTAKSVRFMILETPEIKKAKDDLLQKGDFLTTETTEITETIDNFIFYQNGVVKIFLGCAESQKILLFINFTRSVCSVYSVVSFCSELRDNFPGCSFL